MTQTTTMTQTATPVVLRLSSAHPPVGLTYAAMEEWANEIKTKTDGRITIELITGGALASQNEALDAAKKGIADFALLSAFQEPSRLPLMGISGVMPFNPPDARVLAEIMSTLQERMPEMQAELEKENVKMLWWHCFPDYNIQTTEPIKTLEDFKGMKIACAGATYPLWVQAAGAVPVSMGGADRYSGFQTGMIDGALFPLSLAEGLGFTDFCDYVTLCNLGTLQVAGICVNLDVWKSLSSADQQLIMEISQSVESDYLDKVMLAEESIVPRWTSEMGITFNQLSDADKTTWAEALAPLPYQWAKDWDAKGVPASKVLDEYFKIASELGYEYPVEFTK